jgi:hypothetical protein
MNRIGELNTKLEDLIGIEEANKMFSDATDLAMQELDGGGMLSRGVRYESLILGNVNAALMDYIANSDVMNRAGYSRGQYVGLNDHE